MQSMITMDSQKSLVRDKDENKMFRADYTQYRTIKGF